MNYVPVAQLDRVSASDAEGRGFESPRVRHLKKSHSLGVVFLWLPEWSNPRVRSGS